MELEIYLFSPASYKEASLWPIALVMDSKLSRRSGSPRDPGSHLQFQISLLRLMGQKMMGQKAGPKAGPLFPVPSDQVRELERLQHSGPAKVQLKTRS